MTIYPAQIDTSQSLPTVVDNLTPVQGIVFNRLRNAVLAIESELGVKPSGIYATVRSRVDTLETTLNNLPIIELSGDLGGTLETPLVIGIYGRPISNATPSLFHTLTWNGIAWSPEYIPAGGDLAGYYPSPIVISLQGSAVSDTTPTDDTVLTWVASNNNWEPQIVSKINGATVPAAGTLTTGNVLQVSGASALTYAPVNLAGGANYITGVLPIANQANQTIAGDVTGTTANTTVEAIQGRDILDQTPTAGQVLTWVDGYSSWGPTTLPAGFTAGGDLTGTNEEQTVSYLNGLKTTSSLSASPNEVAVVAYDPIWANPSAIAFDGTDLWVGGSNNTFVGKINAASFNEVTSYDLPADTRARTMVANSTHIFVGCSTTGGILNKLIVLDVTTGAVVGKGTLPSSFSTPLGIALDDTGMVWTVDNTNLQGYVISTLLANGLTPTAPSKTLAIAGCRDVTFGVTSLSEHLLFVADGFSSHIYSIDPATPSIVDTYTDGEGRNLQNVYFPTVDDSPAGLFSVWVTTGTDNSILRINADTLVLIADIESSGTSTSLVHMAGDGTYIYAGDGSSGKVNLFDGGSNTWHSEMESSGMTGTQMGDMIHDGSGAINATITSTSPTGLQGIQKFYSFGADGFFIGGNILKYVGYSSIASYDADNFTIPLRGISGEGIFGYVSPLGASDPDVSASGFIRLTSDTQIVIGALSPNVAFTDMHVLVIGDDNILLGDDTIGKEIKLQTPTTNIVLNDATSSITSTGGWYDAQVTQSLSATYPVAATDREINYAGTSGNLTVNLPVATGSGRILFLTNSHFATAAISVIIQPSAVLPDIIDGKLGGAAYNMTGANSWLQLQDIQTGTWAILSRSYNNATAIKTGAYTIAVEDDFVLVNTGSGAVTVTLPLNPRFGEVHRVHDVGNNAGANAITISRNGNTINSAASNITIAANGAMRTFTWFGGAIGWSSVLSTT